MTSDVSMSFGASTFSFIRQESALDSMRRLRRTGYRRFDVLAVPGHLWPAELSGSARTDLRRALERDDIVVESINPQPIDLNVGSCLQEVREHSVSIYSDAIRLATEIGARGVVVVPGRVAIALPPRAEDTLRWTVDSIAALSQVAREAGLEALLLENHPSTGFPTAVAMCELVDHVGADNVKVAYDVANAEYLGEDQIQAIKLLGNRLGQTHLSDGEPGRWAHDRPGRGAVRFHEILGELDAIEFVGTNIVEIVSQEPLADYLNAAETLGIELSSSTS